MKVLASRVKLAVSPLSKVMSKLYSESDVNAPLLPNCNRCGTAAVDEKVIAFVVTSSTLRGAAPSRVISAWFAETLVIV